MYQVLECDVAVGDEVIRRNGCIVKYRQSYCATIYYFGFENLIPYGLESLRFGGRPEEMNKNAWLCRYSLVVCMRVLKFSYL